MKLFLYLCLEFSAIINMAWSELVKLEAIFNSSIIFFYIPNLLTSITNFSSNSFLICFSFSFLLPCLFLLLPLPLPQTFIYFTVSN